MSETVQYTDDNGVITKTITLEQEVDHQNELTNLYDIKARLEAELASVNASIATLEAM